MQLSIAKKFSKILIIAKGKKYFYFGIVDLINY